MNCWDRGPPSILGSPLLRVSFNPWMGSLISLNSPMRLARLNDQGHFKEIEVTALKRYGIAAIDHVWLAPKVMVFAGCDSGGEGGADG